MLKHHDIMEGDSVWFCTMKQVYGCFTFNNIKLLTLKITLNNIKNNITKGREYYYAIPIFNWINAWLLYMLYRPICYELRNKMQRILKSIRLVLFSNQCNSVKWSVYLIMLFGFQVGFEFVFDVTLTHQVCVDNTCYYQRSNLK